MANKTVTTNQLAVGSIMLVRGKIDFCRITSQIAGKELEDQNEKSRARGYNTEDRPYTTVTIRNAQPIVEDPNNPTPAETYISEARYTSTAHPEKGLLFRGKNVGKILPWVGVVKQGTTNVVEQIKPEGELADGLDVTLVLKVYAGQRNNGVGLDGIIVHEPIRYFSSNDVQKKLGELGITFVPNPAATTFAAETESAAPAAPANPAVPQAPQYQAPAFTAPQPAPQFQQPQTNPNPFAVPQTTQPNSGNGIMWDPSQRNY